MSLSSMFNVLNPNILKLRVPSIFTDISAPKTSAKYTHISTMNVVEALTQKGFFLTSAIQSMSRLDEKRPFAKHMLRFRHASAKPTVGSLYPEVILVNSHNGTSAYRLIAGIYRIVCTNGLIAGSTYDDFHVRHQGDVIGDVIEGTYEVVKKSEKLISLSEDMGKIFINKDEQHYFAQAAHQLRFGDSEMGDCISAEKLLSARRKEDADKNDLFTMFNVVQENIIKGGVKSYTYNSRHYPKRVTTRGINGIDQNTSLNRALWTLAEKMMALKK